MGLLTSSDKSQIVYLKSSHTLGRDAGVADTVLANPLCSRLQCIIGYHKEHWFIEDKSKNGTWLNGKRMPGGKVPLTVGDTVAFPDNAQERWSFSDDTAPKPVLIQKESGRYTELSDPCNILPDEEDPELLITKQGDDWIVEQGEKIYTIHGGSAVILSNALWHFYPNDVIYNTVTQFMESSEGAKLPLLDFDVSLNEENVQMAVRYGASEKDFGYKAHHGLLLELARRCIRDEQSGVAAREHGWLSTDVLIQELGIEPTHLNLLIYRSRKAFESSDIAHTPIERRQGEIRLSPCQLMVRKGDDVLRYQ